MSIKFLTLGFHHVVEKSISNSIFFKSVSKICW